MPDRLSGSIRRRTAVAGAVLALATVAAMAAPASATPSVAIAGDSIGDESRRAIRNAIQPEHRIAWYVTRDSATIGKVGPALLEEVARPDGPDIVLVELGTGNAYWGTSDNEFRHQVHDLTAGLLAHATCVRWIEQKPGGNLAYPGINLRAVRFNRILRDVVNDFDGARTVHYEAWTRLAGDGVFRRDLLHLNPRGQRGLARLARQAVTGCDPALTTGRFWDVADHHWAVAAINAVGAAHWIDGYPNGTFRAEMGGIVTTLDRRDWVRALWRRAGRPAGYPPAPWPDADGPGGDAIAWAAAEDVVALTDEAAFRPTAAVTRGDAIAWLYRAAGRPDPSGYPPHGLTDVSPGLTRAVRWAKGVGILTLADGAAFHPRRGLGRAEAAVLLDRAGPP